MRVSRPEVQRSLLPHMHDTDMMWGMSKHRIEPQGAGSQGRGRASPPVRGSQGRGRIGGRRAGAGPQGGRGRAAAEAAGPQPGQGRGRGRAAAGAGPVTLTAAEARAIASAFQWFAVNREGESAVALLGLLKRAFKKGK